ncbi:hypothetical protein ACFX12_003743 [Malus domestica]
MKTLEYLLPGFSYPHYSVPLNFSIKVGESENTQFDGREQGKYTKDQILQLREMVVLPDEIVKVKHEVKADKDQSWGRTKTNLPA